MHERSRELAMMLEQHRDDARLLYGHRYDDIINPYRVLIGESACRRFIG